MEQAMNVIEVRLKVSLNAVTCTYSLNRHLAKRKFLQLKLLLQALIKDGARWQVYGL